MYESSPWSSPREPWKPPRENVKLTTPVAASNVLDPTSYIHDAQCPGRHVCTIAPVAFLYGSFASVVRSVDIAIGT